MDVSIDSVLASYFVGTEHASGYYAGTPPRETINFTATGSSLVLRFAENNTALPTWSDASPIIDNISISATQSAIAPVPEPETYAMMLAGLGLLGGAAKRRKAKQ